MKNKKIIGLCVAAVVIIVGLSLLYANNNKQPAAVPCAIGDKFDIITGKPCPTVYEEEDPNPTTTADKTRG